MKKIELVFAVCMVVFSTSALAQNNFVVTSGASMHTTGASTITLNNIKLVNNGVLADLQGSIYFIGDAPTANTSIEGSGSNSLYNLVINKNSNAIQLDSDITVSNHLNLTSGGILLNSGSIYLGATGSLQNENEMNYIFGSGGSLQAIANLNAPNLENPGNLGAVISSSENLGTTTITRSHVEQTTDGPSILRTLKIQPTNNSGLNASLVFNYLDVELNGNTEEELVLWQSTDNGSNWSTLTSMLDSSTNKLTVASIDSFNEYTADSSSTLGMENLQNTETFSLFKINESLQIKSSLKIQEIQIFDLTGKRLYFADAINASTHSISLSAIPTQVLTVITQFTNGKQMNKKLIFTNK